jgi:hypothetical protein
MGRFGAMTPSLDQSGIEQCDAHFDRLSGDRLQCRS